jgi:hypothetical protein
MEITIRSPRWKLASDWRNVRQDSITRDESIIGAMLNQL